MSASRIDLHPLGEPLIRHHLAKDTVCSGAAADIAHTDEENGIGRHRVFSYGEATNWTSLASMGIFLRPDGSF